MPEEQGINRENVPELRSYVEKKDAEKGERDYDSIGSQNFSNFMKKFDGIAKKAESAINFVFSFKERAKNTGDKVVGKASEQADRLVEKAQNLWNEIDNKESGTNKKIEGFIGGLLKKVENLGTNLADSLNKKTGEVKGWWAKQQLAFETAQSERAAAKLAQQEKAIAEKQAKYEKAQEEKGRRKEVAYKVAQGKEIGKQGRENFFSLQTESQKAIVAEREESDRKLKALQELYKEEMANQVRLQVLKSRI